MFETLESRRLLAGDLVGHWLADQLAGHLASGDPVTQWMDSQTGSIGTAVGTPIWVANELGGRAVVRFDPSDGDDAFIIDRDENPLSQADDFSIVIAFATSSASLAGGNDEWFRNTGLIDGNSLGLVADWGLSINSTGQLSTGTSGGMGTRPATVYSTAKDLNDGQVHIATVTRRGAELSLYVDDGPVDFRTDTSDATRSRLGLSIGRLLSHQLPFTGDIAELRIYDGQLNPSEVAKVIGEVRTYYSNMPPTPVADRYTLAEDTDLYVVPEPGVLENDVDVDGDAMTVDIVDWPQQGSVLLQSTGQFAYTPNPDFAGIDTFTYRVSDFRSSDQVGVVTLSVTPEYDPAAGVADTYKAVPTQSLTIDSSRGVLANDVNIDDSILAAVLSSEVTAGELTLNRDGSFRYDAQGFAGTASFSYQIDDQIGLSSPTTVTLIVNTEPQSGADVYATDEDAELAVAADHGVLANDNDADGDSVRALIDTPPSHGRIDLADDGSFVYVPDDDFYGSDSFSYRATDDIDTNPPTRVDISVHSVNDFPIAARDAYFTLPNRVLALPSEFGVLSNDRDIEGTRLTAVLAIPPIHGTIELASDGSFTYVPNDTFQGADTFTYRASDGQDLSAIGSVTITIQPRPLYISELMASNANTVTTMLRADDTVEFVGEKLTPDWIELHNRLNEPINIGGLHLTDSPNDPMKWQFPPGTVIPSNDHLVVFASGRNIRETSLDLQGRMHTNFQLDPDGEVLTVTSATGDVIDSFGTYPPQRTGMSYGVSDNGAHEYLVSASPGAANGEGLIDLVDDVQFGVDRGFFSEPFALALHSASEGAAIHYTTDGTIPSETNGELYTRPVVIDKTTTVRASAFREGFVPTVTGTRSYFFPADVVNQDWQATRDAGFPIRWKGVPPDYGLDDPDQFPLIAGDPTLSIEDAKEAIQDSLLSIPTMSIVMDLKDLFGSQGIYANPEQSGQNWERPTSVELIHPDGAEGFQIDSGIRIQGGGSRYFASSKKKSFRLLFKTEYGPSQLEYPLFGSDAVDQFDTLVLRMEFNDGWQWESAQGRPQYARDETMRRTQLAMGQPASHGTYVHVYLNGMYWGLYNVVERPDQSFGESYFGSEPYDWDGRNRGSAINASSDPFRKQRSDNMWRELNGMTGAIYAAATEDEKTAAYMAVQGRNPDGTENAELPKYIDPVNYVDYLITNYYGGNADWPHNNFYVGRENSVDSDGFKFFTWDAEWSLLLFSNRSSSLVNTNLGVTIPLRGLRTSQEFRLLFADRVHQHFFNGGALYVDPDNPQWDPEHPYRNRPAARYVEVTDMIYDALLAESARWGDQHRAQPYVRDIEWQQQYDQLMSEWFPQRTFELLEIFKALDFYPETDVPTFSRRGGTITSQSDIQLSADAGTIYYTIDGTDPRAIGTGISASAIEYTGAFRLGQSTSVAVRALKDGEWSAIDRASFLVDVIPGSGENLRVSEVHYNPGPLSAEELDAGFVDKDEFEFIEFVNISSQTVDLTNVKLARITVQSGEQGVDFDFALGATTRLGPGERVLVVENLAAFETRYGSQLNIAGQWSGGLSNDAEIITVMAGDAIIQQFGYSDEWYSSTDGAGASLEHVGIANDDLGSWNLPESWRASWTRGGSPGHPRSVKVLGDSNGDGVFDSSDLTAALAAGEFEDTVANNSTFEEGDWDQDGDFTSADLAFALQQGNYVDARTALLARRSFQSGDARRLIFADWPNDAMMLPNRVKGLEMSDLLSAIDDST